jgi:hypothetical protein
VAYYNSNRQSGFPALSIEYDNGTDTFFESYTIFPETFTVNSQTLDQIMQSIVDGFAYLRWDYEDTKIHVRFPIKGSTRWDQYLSSAGSDFTYTDVDEIEQIGEDINFPEGYNSVLVTGVEEPGESDHTIDIEADPDLNPDNTITVGESNFLDFYTYPYNMEMEITINVGTITFLRDVTKEVTETITFEDRKGSSERPIYSLTSYSWHGTNLGALSFNQDRSDFECEIDGCSVCEVTYVTRYHVYQAVVNELGGVIICATEVISV